MKKLLSAAVAIVMGATCIASLAACNTGNDTETAQKAIKSIRSTYIEKAKDTAADYTVMGQVKVDDNMYAVNWSVSPAEGCAVNDISGYVSVGAMAEDKQVTVSITQGEVAVAYTLKASVTVGKATESVEFARNVPAIPGTTPITVAAAIALATNLENGEYYKANGEERQVYVKGYVTDVGTAESTRIKNVVIADSLDAATADSVKIGSLNYSDVFPKGSTLNVGDQITVKAYVEKFNGGVSLYANSKGENYPEVTEIERVPKTDAEKVADAKKEVTLQGVFVEGEVTLPSEKNGATVSWEVVGDTTVVSVADSKLTITEPEAETEVTLKATIASGNESDTKDIVIKVVKKSNKGTAENPYTAAEATAIAKGLTKGAYYYVNNEPQKIYVKGYITVLGTWDTKNNRYNNTYIADEAGAAQADSLLVYTVTAQAETVLTKAGDIAENELITFCGYIQNYNNTAEITYNGSNVVTAVEKTADERTDEEKAQAAIDAVKIPSIVTDNIVLKSTVIGVSLAITNSTNPNAINTSGIVVRSTSDVDLTLTVTATIGEVTKTKDFEVTVQGQPTGNLALLTTSISNITGGSATAYASYNGKRVVDGYTVATSQVMQSTQGSGDNKVAVLQMQKAKASITVNGKFSTIVIKVYSTATEVDKVVKPVVKVGSTTLTPVVSETTENTVVDGGKIYTLTYTVSGTGYQDVVISDGNATTYLTAIDFTYAE